MFEQRLAEGVEGEHRIARKLLDIGVAVAPLYQFENQGTAPHMLGKLGCDQIKRVLPDLTCWGETAFFAEVKRKQRWVTYSGFLETGLNARLFREYCDVQALTGCPVFLFFLHESQLPTGVWIGRIDRLRARCREWAGSRPDGSVVSKPLTLFPASTLTKIWELAEVPS